MFANIGDFLNSMEMQMVRDLCDVLEIPLDLFSRFEDMYSHALRVKYSSLSHYGLQQVKMGSKHTWLSGYRESC